MIAPDPDDWDDSVILKVFHDSLKKHTTREKEQEKAREETAVVQVQDATSSNAWSTVAAGDAKRRKLNEKDGSSADSKKPVGFQAALNNFLASKKKATTSSSKTTSTSTSTSTAETRQALNTNGESHAALPVNNFQQSSSACSAITAVSTEGSKRVHFSDGEEKNGGNTEDSQSGSFDSHQYQYNHLYPQQAGFVAPVAVTSTMIDDAMQAMLMAWYQSGYATGRYQTLCEISGHPIGAYNGAAYQREANDDSSK